MGILLIRYRAPRRIISSAITSFWLLLFVLLGQPSSYGHELAAGVGTQSTFTIRDGQVTMLFNLGWSVPAGFPVLQSLDHNGDDRVEEDEWRPYLKSRIESLLTQVQLHINGHPISLELVLIEEEGLQGSVRTRPFDAYYTLRGQLPASFSETNPWGNGWWLHWQDNTFLNETSSQFTWIPLSDHDPGMSFLILRPEPAAIEDQGAFFRTPGRESTVYFYKGTSTFDPFESDPPTVSDLIKVASSAEQTTAPTDADLSQSAGGDVIPRRPTNTNTDQQQAPEHSEEEEIGEIVTTLLEGKAPLWELLLALLLAILYGAGHALGPGHGKTMVAAYLVGTRGRIRDAVILGLVVTFAHTASIFLLGLLLLALIEASSDKASSATYQNWLTTIFSFGSGFLLLLFGLFLARRRWRNARGSTHTHGHDHSHADSHDHSHNHSHDGHPHDHSHVPANWGQDGEVRFRDLVTLGFSGGIVPCPAGFTIMLVAAHFQALLLGLVILGFFSLGLGLMLIGIGCVLVVGREGLLDRAGSTLQTRFLRYAPVFSALLVSAVGFWFCYDSVIQGQDSIVQMLRVLADRLDG